MNRHPGWVNWPPAAGPGGDEDGAGHRGGLGGTRYRTTCDTALVGEQLGQPEPGDPPVFVCCDPELRVWVVAQPEPQGVQDLLGRPPGSRDEEDMPEAVLVVSIACSDRRADLLGGSGHPGLLLAGETGRHPAP